MGWTSTTSLQVACLAALLGTVASAWVVSQTPRNLVAVPTNGEVASMPGGANRGGEFEVRRQRHPLTPQDVAAADLADGDWPALFGPDGSSRVAGPAPSRAWGIEGPAEEWRIEVGRGYSAPVVAAGRVIVFHRIGDEERLSAFDPSTGSRLWEAADPTAFRCLYEYSDGPYATPRISGEFVFTVGAEGRLNCRRSTDGELVWRRDLRADFDLKPGKFGYGPQLFVNDRYVALNVGGANAGIVAIDKATGATIWTATDHAAAYTMPVAVRVEDAELLVTLTDQGLVCLNAETGELLDETPFRSKVVDSVSGVTPIVSGDQVFAVAGRGVGAGCWQVTREGRLRERWRDRRALDSLFNTLVLADGRVFGFTSARQGAAALREIDMATGRVAWSHSSDLERGQALLVGDTLVALGEQGHVALFDIASRPPRLIAQSTRPLLAAPCYSAPAFAAGRLYARNEVELVGWRLDDPQRAAVRSR